MFSFWDTAHFKARENFEMSWWITICLKYNQNKEWRCKRGANNGQIFSVFWQPYLHNIWLMLNQGPLLLKILCCNFSSKVFFLILHCHKCNLFSFSNQLTKYICRMETSIWFLFFTLQSFMMYHKHKLESFLERADIVKPWK